MDNLLRPHYLCTLTYENGGLPESFDSVVLEFCKKKFPTYFIAKEFGHNGNNPHFHIVHTIPLDSTLESWRKNGTRAWKQLYLAHNLTRIVPKVTIDNKQCPTYMNVIGGYLQKDSITQTLANVGYDLAEMIKQAEYNNRSKKCKIEDFIHMVHKWQQSLAEGSETETNLLSIYNWQPKWNEQAIFNYSVSKMFREGYNINHIVSSKKILTEQYKCFRVYYEYENFETEPV